MNKGRKAWAVSIAVMLSIGLLGAAAGADTVPINLNTWSEQGVPANGNWVVTADGSSVNQTINGNPTFFVSPGNYSNTEFKGKFKVTTGGDDDYIGFVFGYNKPIAPGDPTTLYDFILFDWKQVNQSYGGYLAQEGFTLSRVNGTIAAASDWKYFWGHTADPPLLTVLGSDYGSTRGWADNTEYEFTLLYQTNRIKIDIKGGTGDFKDGQTIFDAVGGPFPDGRFGFYNFSQSGVNYQGFTEEYVVPVPASVWLLAPGLLWLLPRRRQTS